MVLLALDKWGQHVRDGTHAAFLAGHIERAAARPVHRQRGGQERPLQEPAADSGDVVIV